MQKIIYKIEFDSIKTIDNLLCQERTVGEEYDVGNGERKEVVSLDENWDKGKYCIIIHYDGGFEDIVFDIQHIFKKLILN